MNNLSLFEKVNTLTLDTLPRTLMLLGEYGCGKKMLVEKIGKVLNIETEDITDNLSLELIDDITQRVHPKIYTIDGNKLTVRTENVILKFLEEPLKNAYIILLAESRASLLQTVLNRCQVWEFEQYDENFLRGFITTDCDVDKLLLVANTPGKVIEYQTYPIEQMYALAAKIFLNVEKANFANTLTLSKYIAFKNEQDRYDFNLFTDILLVVCREMYSDKLVSSDVYEKVYSLCNHKRVLNVDKKALFEHFLIELKLLYTKRGT